MRYLILCLSISLLASSCAMIKQKSWLKNHDSLLQESLLSEDAEEMMDGLTSSLVSMMDQSLGFVDPRKGAEYVKKYTKQNKGSIDQIINNLDANMEGMGPLDKASMAIGMLKKPQIKELVKLAPKFQKKFKQISFMTRVLGKLTKVFGSLG